MWRLLRGQPGLWLTVAAVLLVVAVTGVFIAAAGRPPSPRPSTAALPSPSPAVTFVPTPGPTASVCVSVAAWPLDRRLEQLLIVTGLFANLGASSPEARAGVGALVLFGQPAAGAGPEIRQGLAQLRAAAATEGQVTPWLATDEEGGQVQRLSALAGPLPAPRQMAELWTPDQLRTALQAHAEALRALGIDMDLAPVLDVAPADDLVADEAHRSFSDDPAVVSAEGVAYLAGLRDGGVTPVVKHFPGLGHADANTDLTASTDPPLSSLQSLDLLPFAAAIAAQVGVVMVSHVRVPGLTGSVPASLSPATYNLLRSGLGFSGVAMTDALDAGAVSAAGFSQAGAAALAVEAGADLAMVDASAWQSALAALRRAVATGALSEAALDARVGRVLAAKGVAVCAGTSA